jgi:hypothetical protein
MIKVACMEASSSSSSFSLINNFKNLNVCIIMLIMSIIYITSLIEVNGIDHEYILLN